jgi:hypothetical protein
LAFRASLHFVGGSNSGKGEEKRKERKKERKERKRKKEFGYSSRF